MLIGQLMAIDLRRCTKPEFLNFYVQRTVLAIYSPMIYTDPCLMRAYPLRGQVGGGLGPGNLKYFGPKMALTYRLDVISQGPKNSRFSGPNPPPTCPRNGSACIKNITHGQGCGSRSADPDSIGSVDPDKR
jgi:hypothetical protein